MNTTFKTLDMCLLNILFVVLFLAVIASSERQLSERFKRAAEPKLFIPLKNKDNVQYTFDIFIGTPEQKFCVHVDTGSFDLWVQSTESPNGNKPVQKFNRGLSSTIVKVNNKPFHLKYGDGGTFEGDVVADVVTLRGRTTEVKIKQQVFGLVTSHANANNIDVDGIFGLAFKEGSLYSGQPDPTVYSLMNKYGFNSQIGLFLNREDEPDGELVFGGINEDLVEGEFTFTNIPNGAAQYNWAVMLDGIAVNGKPIPNSRIIGILDSGASRILGPSTIVNGINNALWGYSQEFLKKPSFKCREVNMNDLLDITFYINNKAFKLPSQALISQLYSVTSDYEALMKTFSKFGMSESEIKKMAQSNAECEYLMVIDPSENSYPDNTRIIILGVPFMREFYTQIDFNERIIGIAKARHGLRTMPKPTITKPPSRQRVEPSTNMSPPMPVQSGGSAGVKPPGYRFPPVIFEKPSPYEQPSEKASYGSLDKPPKSLTSVVGSPISSEKETPAANNQEKVTSLQQPTVQPVQETTEHNIRNRNVIVRSYKSITSFFSYYYNTMLVALLNMITR